MRQDIIRSLSVIMANSAMLTVLSTTAFAQDTTSAVEAPVGDSAVIAPVVPDSTISAPAAGSVAAGAPVITLPEITLPDDPSAPAPASTTPEARTASSQPGRPSGTAASAPKAHSASNAASAGKPGAAATPSTASASSRPEALAGPDIDPAPNLAGGELPADGRIIAAVPPGDGPLQPSAAGSSANQPSEALPEGALAGLLGLIVVGAAGGFVAVTRRRKRGDHADYRDAVVAETQPEQPAPNRPTVARPPNDLPLPEPTDWKPRNAVQEAAMAMMADGPPPVGRERADLLRAMTAAAPDRFNPFTSPKGRRHRARLILQTREQMWEDRVAQPFDWRTHEPTTKPATREPAGLVIA